ncbi:MAG: MTAP family purine nucleoside phosphorylase [Syntrophales bacterium LBB04]|nr:MTAP family purine nucleoside phosphorylase [Syntrophales bacterium LBB04]
MLGIITGTVLLKDFIIGSKSHNVLKSNNYGQAELNISEKLILISRHGTDRSRHILPHMIKHRANITALKDLGVTDIIGINSTGSLKIRHKPGTIVIPDDFIMLAPYPSIYENEPVHITPRLDMTLRNHCLAAASQLGISAIDGGTYWQTQGPRLETRAEIKLMAKFADLVGMTMASEAIIAQELGMSYAAICSVDNYANGIAAKELTMAEISSQAQRSGETISRIIYQLTEATN